jgi:DNA-directed RNA polymerase specialized sigma24 family protein
MKPDREDLILEYLPFADLMTANFLAKRPSFNYIAEDLFQHVRVKLIEAVDTVLEKKEFLPGEFKGFLRICIVRVISDFARSNELIQTIPRDKFTPVEPLREDVEDYRGGVLEGAGQTMLGLYAVCRDAKDCTILHLKADGGTYEEIHEATGLAVRTIQNRLGEIHRRYKAKKLCDSRQD